MRHFRKIGLLSAIALIGFWWPLHLLAENPTDCDLRISATSDQSQREYFKDKDKDKDNDNVIISVTVKNISGQEVTVLQQGPSKGVKIFALDHTGARKLIYPAKGNSPVISMRWCAVVAPGESLSWKFSVPFMMLDQNNAGLVASIRQLASGHQKKISDAYSAPFTISGSGQSNSPPKKDATSK